MHALIVLLISLMLAGPVFAQAPLDVRYLLVDLTHPSWTALKIILTDRHQEIRSGNELSITLNDDETQGIVKILGATPAWRSANGLIGHPAVLESHPDNAWAIDLFRNGPAWVIQRTGPETP